MQSVLVFTLNLLLYVKDEAYITELLEEKIQLKELTETDGHYTG